MKKRYRIKYLKSIDKFVIHLYQTCWVNGKLSKKKMWRRFWGVDFHTESMARKFAEGSF